MIKNSSALVLALLALFFWGTDFARADDATDMMEAAIAQQTDKTEEPAVAQPAAIPAVSPVAAEPVQARDVLPAEQKPAVLTESEPQDDSAKAEGEVSSALADAAASGQLMIADFDTGDKPNNLGGDFGAWDKDPNDDTQSCRATLASDDSEGNVEGFALRLDYDVDSPSPAYNGFWMKLENLNATPYDTLSFSVRGAGHNFTKRLKVEIKTPDNRSSEFFISGITDQWKKLEIPLKRFKGIKNWAALGEMIFVFDDVNTAPKKGTILIDQIKLERLEKGMAVIPAAEPAA